MKRWLCRTDSTTGESILLVGSIHVTTGRQEPVVAAPTMASGRPGRLVGGLLYQLASKLNEWSFELRASVPACALPVVFSGIMFQDTFTRYDSRFGSCTEYSPLTATAKNTWPVAVFVNSTLAG